MQPQQLTPEEQRDLELARSARDKRARGLVPTTVEVNAEDRVREAAAARLMLAMRPSFFQSFFDIQSKQCKDWEERYNIPCGKGRKTINLAEVFAALRGLIARNKSLLDTSDGDNGGDVTSLKRDKLAAEVRKLESQREKLLVEIQEKQRQVVPIEHMRERLGRMAGYLRQLGDTFARKSDLTGPRAQAMLNDTIGKFEREIGRLGE